MENKEGITTEEMFPGEFHQQEISSSEHQETNDETPRKPRLKEIDRKQMILRPIDVENLVEKDHEVRAIWELIGRLDLSPY